MSTRVGEALAFYIRNFDDVEALRELTDPPEGISAAEWRLVRTVVKDRADADAAELLQTLSRDGIAKSVDEARRFCDEMPGNVRKSWAFKMSIYDDADGPERMQIGVAIDSDHSFGPWLGVYLDFSRKRTTSLRRAGDFLAARNVAFSKLTVPDRGWTGQLVVKRHSLKPDSSVDECVAWVRETCSFLLRDVFDHIAVPAR